MQSQIEEFVAKAELYAQYSGLIAKRLADRMVSGFQSLLTIDDVTHYEYFRDKAIALAKRGLYQRSRPLLEKLHATAPEDHEVALYLGVARIKADDRAGGIALLEEAYRLDKKNMKIATVLGLTYVQAEDYKKAVPLLTAAVKESPENFNLHYRLGVAHDHLGAHDKAIECFQAALALRPDELPVMERLSGVYRATRQWHQAVKLL